MKKYIILCFALVCYSLSYAQQNLMEVMTVYLKNGQKLVVDSKSIDVSFGGNFDRESVWSDEIYHYNSWEGFQTLAYYRADGFEGQLSDLQRISSGVYIAAMAWKYPLLYEFGNAKTGLCFGTSEDLTVENSDTVFSDVPKDPWLNVNGSIGVVGTKSVLPAEANRYMSLRYGEDVWDRSVYTLEDLNGSRPWIGLSNVWFDHLLISGKTYYYRPFIAVYGFENNGEEVLVNPEPSSTPTYLYGEVASFRVPKLVTDFGYEDAHDGGICPQQSLDDFAAAHADHFLTHSLYMAGMLRPYLMQYLESADARTDFDLANIRKETCDNGSVYLPESISDAFCQWLDKTVVPQEMVVNSLDQVVPEANDGRSSPQQWTREYNMTSQLVTDVDPSWGVPGNQYMMFAGSSHVSTPMVSFDFSTALPGKYQVIVTFAPNTLLDNIEEAIPTKMKVWAYGRGDDGQMVHNNNDARCTNFTPNFSDDFVEASGKETTTVVISPCYELTSVGCYIKLDVIRSTVERLQNLYDNNLRVAEIRLVPVTE